MELLHLRYFCTIAELKSVTSAANSLHVSQPSLSRSLKTLENEIGVTLFERSNKEMVLTDAGKILFNDAKRAINILDSSLAKLRGDYCHDKDITIMTSLSGDFLSMISSFGEKYPNIEINYNNSIFSFENLDNKSIYIIPDPDIPASLESKINKIQLCTEEIVLFFSKSSNLLSDSSVDLRDLKNETFILPDKSSTLYTFVKKMFDTAGFTPKTASSNYPNLKLLVKLGVGIAIFPESSAITTDDSTNVLHIIYPSPYRPIYIIWLKEVPMTLAAKQFISYARKWFGNKL